jgi:hypothetical protein
MSQPVKVSCWHQTADVSPERKLRATLTRRLNTGAAPPVEVAVWESPDPGDDGAPGRVQGEDHGDTPAVKVENVADDGKQREIEGGRRPPRPPPVRPSQPAAARRPGGPEPRPGPARPSHPAPTPVTAGPPPRTGAAAVRPTLRGPPARPRGGQQLLDQAASRTSRPYFLSTVVATVLAAAPSRRQGRVARRRVATGQSRWPPADANPRRPDRDLANRPRRAGTASATRVRMTDGCHRSSLHR